MVTLITGMISKYLGVAPRTVSRWIDSGAMKGIRLPNSQDRRVIFEDFSLFCRTHGYPIPTRDLQPATKLYVFGATRLEEYQCFDSAFELGRACASNPPRLIVVIENDALVKELERLKYPVLNASDMTYNEISKHLKGIESA